MLKRNGNKRFAMKMSAVGAVLLGVLGSLLWVNLANAQVKPPYASYAVKFACGEFGKTLAASAPSVPEGPVVPGYYQTSINIHNPQAQHTVVFEKKAVLLYSGRAPIHEGAFERPLAPGKFVSRQLPPDFGMLIDCQDIRAVLLPTAPAAPTFIEGYVVIQVPPTGSADTTNTSLPLDVQAIYTSTGYAGTAAALSRSGIAEQVVVVQPTMVTG
jgi:hypothetical protein